MNVTNCTECIGIGDDIYLGAGHTYMQEMSAALADGFSSGILDQRQTVTNLQSDIDHPSQSMADLMHRFGTDLMLAWPIPRGII